MEVDPYEHAASPPASQTTAAVPATLEEPVAADQATGTFNPSSSLLAGSSQQLGPSQGAPLGSGIIVSQGQQQDTAGGADEQAPPGFGAMIARELGDSFAEFFSSTLSGQAETLDKSIQELVDHCDASVQAAVAGRDAGLSEIEGLRSAVQRFRDQVTQALEGPVHASGTAAGH